MSHGGYARNFAHNENTFVLSIIWLKLKHTFWWNCWDCKNSNKFVFLPFVSHALHVHIVQQPSPVCQKHCRFTQRRNIVNLWHEYITNVIVFLVVNNLTLMIKIPMVYLWSTYGLHMVYHRSTIGLPMVKVWFWEVSSFQAKKNLTYENSMFGSFLCDPLVVANDIIMQAWSSVLMCPKPTS